MPRLDLVVETPLSRSSRARQIEAMFDVPGEEITRLAWRGDVPLDERPWSIGLITGPSGSGKSTCLRGLFGEPLTLTWGAPSVLDDFGPHGIETIAGVCQAVGFNTIPAWLRPYRVLSMGEQFRVGLARTLLEDRREVIVLDEFTSVVDRQVAKIGAHAVQKYVRARPGTQLVAATCHGDVEDWLQPDWVLEPATMTFRWRVLQRRPSLEGTIQRVPHAAWSLFAPFHYLTAELARSAACYVLFIEGAPAVFAGMLHRPHPKVHDIMGISRVVTLPDWQGLGLAFHLMDRLAAWSKAIGKRVHMYPAHPGFVRSFAKSPVWACLKRPGVYSLLSMGKLTGHAHKIGTFGGRPNAVFAYTGPAWDDAREARALLAGEAGA